MLCSISIWSSFYAYDVTLHYPKSTFSLNAISFQLPKGSIVGFVGKNGAGKSTTIQAILNIIKPESGEIRILDQVLSEDNDSLKNEIGVVFDCSVFYEELTAKQLNQVFSNIYTNWNQQQYEGFLTQFGLPYAKKIKTFSRGMNMKLSLAVALSHQASILLLDEATAGLDPVAREEVLDILLDFVKNEENSVLLSSHISSDLEKVADFITIIDYGNIVCSEAKDTLLFSYGIARMKQKDFELLKSEEYLSYRQRGQQVDVLVENRRKFAQNYPDILLDQPTIDEILVFLTKGEA